MTEQKAIDELNSCHAFGLSSECRSLAKIALEKQIPKKPTNYTKEYDDLLGMDYIQRYCDCGNKIYRRQSYCEDCGQKIDWT